MTTFWLLSIDAFLRFDVLTAVTVLITAYRDVTPYSLLDCYQRSEESIASVPEDGDNRR
jgi:hypothetical protein